MKRFDKFVADVNGLRKVLYSHCHKLFIPTTHRRNDSCLGKKLKPTTKRRWLNKLATMLENNEI